jgi:hypothetical protein
VRSFTLNGKPWIKCFAVIGALLLTLGRTGFGSEPSQQGPWLVQRSDTDAGRIEYSAVTPSIEDSDFWLGVFCFGGDRLFVTLSDTARGAFSAADRQSAFRIAFDGGTSLQSIRRRAEICVFRRRSLTPHRRPNLTLAKRPNHQSTQVCERHVGGSILRADRLPI